MTENDVFDKVFYQMQQGIYIFLRLGLWREAFGVAIEYEILLEDAGREDEARRATEMRVALDRLRKV